MDQVEKASLALHHSFRSLSLVYLGSWSSPGTRDISLLRTKKHNGSGFLTKVDIYHLLQQLSLPLCNLVEETIISHIYVQKHSTLSHKHIQLLI